MSSSRSCPHLLCNFVALVASTTGIGLLGWVGWAVGVWTGEKWWIRYAVRWKMWNPEVHQQFPAAFQQVTKESERAIEVEIHKYRDR